MTTVLRLLFEILFSLLHGLVIYVVREINMKTKFIIAVLRLLSWIPLPILHGLAIIIGYFLYWLPNTLKRTATINLSLCFPEMSLKERQILLRKSLIESVKTALEMGAMWFWSVERLNKLDKGVVGFERWQTLCKQGKGVIALTPHIGQWEFLGIFSQQYIAMTSLYRPPKMADLDAFLVKVRNRSGNTLVPTTSSGVRALYTSLKKGYMAGILPDQDPGSSGVFAPFFGIEANTMTLITKLAQRTHAAVIIAYAERLPWGRGFVTHIYEIDSKEITDPDPIVATTALNKAIERCVREKPEQYQWVYKRFKKRPKGEKKVY